MLRYCADCGKPIEFGIYYHDDLHCEDCLRDHVIDMDIDKIAWTFESEIEEYECPDIEYIISSIDIWTIIKRLLLDVWERGD